MRGIRDEMGREYGRITKEAKIDPGTAGDAGEEVWAKLLRNWLPDKYKVITKGRVITPDGRQSPQMDVIVLHGWYPRALEHTKYYFSSAVVAAFECKLTLRKQDIRDAFSRGAALKQLYEPVLGTVYTELQQPVIFGVLAHSYARKRGVKPDVEPVIDAIGTHLGYGCDHPRELLDVVCVADTATLVMQKDVCIPGFSDPEFAEMFVDEPRGEGVGVGMLYQDNEILPGRLYNPTGDVFGALINHVVNVLAHQDSTLREFARYLSDIGGWFGIGRFTGYAGTVFSSRVAKRLRKEGFDESPWSLWSSRV